MAAQKPSTSSARLWLVRHGQTDWNMQFRIQGHTPTELNEEGRRQAGQLADFFRNKNFAAIWSSDLPRAAQTAQIIAQPLGLEIQTMPELRERDLRNFAGKTWDEIRNLRGEVPGGLPPSGDLADWTGVPGVENDEQVWQRVSHILHSLANQYAGRDVLVVTHGGVVKHALCQILGIPPHVPRRFTLANGIVAVLQRRVDYFTLVSLIDVALIAGEAGAADTAMKG